MSTRSLIAKKFLDGSIQCIYCHYDGYYQGVGQMLQTYYQTLEKVNELIALGDISTLQAKLHPTISTHCFEKPEKNVTVAYMRDRHELGLQAKSFGSIESFCMYYNESWCEYYYVYDQQSSTWYCGEGFILEKMELTPLKEVL